VRIWKELSNNRFRYVGDDTLSSNYSTGKETNRIELLREIQGGLHQGITVVGMQGVISGLVVKMTSR
jgi:hypothetical protein